MPKLTTKPSHHTTSLIQSAYKKKFLRIVNTLSAIMNTMNCIATHQLYALHTATHIKDKLFQMN